MAGRADRSAAYAELVTGLLEARHDAASARFDTEIAAAEADGRIDERTARVLRWWQRESVRAVVDHARAVIPPALGAIDAADQDAERHNADAAQAWERATSRALPVLGLHAREVSGPADELSDPRPAAELPTPAAALEPDPEPPVATNPEPRLELRIPAARPAQPDESPRRRLIVAGLNPLPRGGSPGHSRRDTALDGPDRRKD